MLTLLQLTPDQAHEQYEQNLMLWCGLLMVIVVIGGTALSMLRRRMKAAPGPPDLSGGLTLSTLRDMRDRGVLTAEEYEATKAQVIAQVKAAEEKTSGSKTPPPKANP